jgi:hypothetical protein
MKPLTVAEALRVWGHDMGWDTDITEEDMEPTDTYPGTKDRVRVMRERVDRGEPLYHSKDRGFAE